MKKLVIALFVLGMALPSFAGGLKVKDVVGTWTYELEVDYNTMTGKLVFEADGKELSGEVLTDDGQTIPMTKVEIRENEVLYFELEVDYTVMKSSMTIDGKKYTGNIAVEGAELTVSGEKIE